MTDTRSRIDLHVHSTRSGIGGGTLQRLLEMKDSYTRPDEVYQLALSRGMDFVTITDHDSIDAAADLAHYPKFFISEEINARFPEDGTGLHVVALNLTEEHHRMIQEIRWNVYELVGYLRREDIVHFVAHPFFPVTDPPTIEHLEKMLLLFTIFEVKNGGKQLVPDDLLELILDRLTPDFLARLADKHDLPPIGEMPWRKRMVAGSDDHAGAFIGYPHTSCPEVHTVDQLLDAIRTGRCRPEGQGGSALTVAHSVLAIAYRHCKAARRGTSFTAEAAWSLLGQLLDNANLDRSLAFPARAFLFFNDTVLGTKKQTLPPTPVTFLKDRLASAAQTDPDLRAFLRDGLDFSPTNNERLFKVMAAVSNDALRTLTTALDGDRPRKSRDLARVASGITGLGVVLAPYLAAFRAESRDRPLMRSVRERWLSDGQTPVPSVAMFADEASHGLTEDAEALALMEPELAEGSAIELFGLAAAGSKQSEGLFEAVATVPLHWFPTGRVALPPTLEVAHALVNRDVQALYVHSVGPMGLLGALLGGLLRIPVVARCPVECLAHAETSSLFERYLQLFFGLCREVRASSQEAHDAALAFGVPADSTILAERVAVSTAA